MWLALFVVATWARPLRAELVVLDDGEFLKVKTFEIDGERARLIFASGGRLTLPLDRIERILDDEVVPAPDPLPVTAEAIPPPAPTPTVALRFEESSRVPEGPYGEQIYAAARKHQVNPQVIAALVRAESSGNPRAVSRKGARGLMQLMPATAKRFGVKPERLFDPVQNIEAGVKYLRWLIDQFPNDLASVLAAYNAGERAVERYGGIPPYRETRGYVRRIYTTLGLAIHDLPN